MKQWLAVLGTIFAITATSISAQAAKPQPQPSPFAGVWCGPISIWTGPVAHLNISSSGQISGGDHSRFSLSYSGRVTHDGVMALTITTDTLRSFRHTVRIKIRITALVGFDDQGNLTGIGETDDGGPVAFIWSPCP